MHYEQVSTSVTDDESIPWIPYAPHAAGVQLKVFKVNPTRGEMLLMMKVPALTQLPRHHHTGAVTVYTRQGRWKYEEHSWIACPGSVVFGTAGRSHTPQVLSSDCEVLTLTHVCGELLLFDRKDQLLAIENWQSMLQRYLSYCRQRRIVPHDITAFH
ncbi:MAG TPA: 2,4'-dihydroxyacetophenone dioxygenase family protein [Burkholderiaceae bacterium]